MKKILPILLCYILMTSQVFAISGGPVFGGGGLNPIGTYSGIIQVKSETDYNNTTYNPATGKFEPTVTTGVNALGLFSLGVPTTSVATGSFLIFVDGIVFRGTITASVNPDTDRLNGIINGTYNYTLNVTTTTVTGTPPDQVVTETVTPVAVTAQANGQVAARISNTRAGSISSATLIGTSNVSITDGGVSGNGGGGVTFRADRSLDCTVSGFRQSTTSSAATTVNTGASGN